MLYDQVGMKGDMEPQISRVMPDTHVSHQASHILSAQPQVAYPGQYYLR